LMHLKCLQILWNIS